jgi:adenosylhomocysteine nucleosidase
MQETSMIGLILATRIEAEPFVEALGLRKIEKSPLPVYKGAGARLVISGIGKTNAAIAATYCCAVFHPGWIVNLGAAGSTKASYGLGDTCHITKIIEWDRPRLSSNSPHVHQPHVLRGFREAVLATQDRPVIDRDHRRVIEPYADLADMEGAAVVQAARRLGTPGVLFKFVSDTPDDGSDADIVARIKDYGIGFCRFVTDSVFPALKKEKKP